MITRFKTYEGNLLFKDKIKQLIPEIYVIFEYPLFNFTELKYYRYLVLGKVNSIPYQQDTNTFIEIRVVDYITNEKDIHYLDFVNKKIYNVDIISDIKYTSSSLKDTEIEYEKFKDEFEIKINADKYNL